MPTRVFARIVIFFVALILAVWHFVLGALTRQHTRDSTCRHGLVTVACESLIWAPVEWWRTVERHTSRLRHGRAVSR
jgi:hypothetical protein